MKINWSSLWKKEDWWALWIGLFVVLLSVGTIFGRDLIGWGVTTNVWLNINKALSPATKNFASIPGIVSLLLTYLFMLAIMVLGARLMKFDVKKFIIGFSIIFWIAYAAYLAGNYAYIAATPDKLKSFGIHWSLGLTGEIGYVVALIVGLVIANFFPKLAGYVKEGTRPEWFVKTGIVILGASLGVSAAAAFGIASSVIFRGLAAIIEAYLIYWALVYFVARKFFKFSPEWSAPLASGVSICGVAAAIATAAAIKAKPIIPIMISSLVVIFAVVELLVLPFVAQALLSHQPLVSAAWMGLAVKTDGAAVASGTITESLVRAKAATEGINYQEGWMLMTTTTVKVFIDIFIGVWAFVLSLIWVRHINKKQGEEQGAKAYVGQIWDRIPKFVIGYFIAFLALLALVLTVPSLTNVAKTATAEGNIFRVLFFTMTFFAIGLATNFRKLWGQGLGKLAGVYVLSLFGFVLWIGLAISFIFFGGVLPPAS